MLRQKKNEELNNEKIQLIKNRIRKNCSPKHVPSIIIKVPEIPRTKSGKIVELAVKKVINGEELNNKEAISNPDSLNYFKDIKDYRRKMLNQSKTYFTPINNQTSKEFKNLFDKFVDKGEIHIKKVRTKSRDIRFEKCTSNIVFCSFLELCKNNLAHEDYLNIAKTFQLIFISKVPVFDNSISDQCRRFISLIDMLYDQQCTVVLLAEQPISKLCQIKNLNKEFERTASRLYEMTIINSVNNEKNNY